MPWRSVLALTLLPAAVAAAATGSSDPEPPSAAAAAEMASASAAAADDAPGAAAETLLAALADPALSDLAAEVLRGNPGLAAAAARARAAEHRVAQAGALPDPMAAVTAYLAAPETRVGPQRLMATLSQRLPWLPRLRLRERLALYEAAVLAAGVEAERLALVTETRRLAHELVFAADQARVLGRKRAHLIEHESVARARYATGSGLLRDAVKLQAEVARVDQALLVVETRRRELEEALNALRGAPSGTPLPAARAALPEALPVELEALRRRALAARPEMAAAAAEVARAETGVELAESEFKPDLSVGLTYALVERRDDAAGRASPPEGNGGDVFGVVGGVTVPLWRERRRAGVAEAAEQRSAAGEARRATAVRIERELGELAARLPLDLARVRLFEEELIPQADEALRSVESAYSAGTAAALDLLDAEHVLYDAYIALARARADWAVSRARLEGAVAGRLEPGADDDGGDDD